MQYINLHINTMLYIFHLHSTTHYLQLKYIFSIRKKYRTVTQSGFNGYYIYSTSAPTQVTYLAGDHQWLL